jgi:hypothetical protein
MDTSRSSAIHHSNVETNQPAIPWLAGTLGCQHRETELNVHYLYTKHQVARSTRADAETNDAFYLLKNVSLLRLTYQIRLLTFRAFSSRRKLVLRIPARCRLHSTLKDFQKEQSKIVRIERV